MVLQEAMRLSQAALNGLVYYHTYDQALLQSIITVAYLGWMGLLGTYLLRAFPPGDMGSLSYIHRPLVFSSARAATCTGLLVSWMLLMYRRAPFLFYAYTAMPVLFWYAYLICHRCCFQRGVCMQGFLNFAMAYGDHFPLFNSAIGLRCDMLFTLSILIVF